MGNKKKRQGDSDGKLPPYDVGMIRDFIDHLKWELRVAHFENAEGVKSGGKPGRINLELVDQLNKFFEKRPRVLLQGLAINAEGVPPDISLAMRKEIFVEREAMRQEQIDHLEALEPLFKEALSCARQEVKTSDDLPMTYLKLANMVATWEAEDEDDDKT